MVNQCGAEGPHELLSKKDIVRTLPSSVVDGISVSVPVTSPTLVVIVLCTMAIWRRAGVTSRRHVPSNRRVRGTVQTLSERTRSTRQLALPRLHGQVRIHLAVNLLHGQQGLFERWLFKQTARSVWSAITLKYLKYTLG